MSWSTREIAELAGTTLRAVRHYHEVGLLNEPERRTNGYKDYGVDHLLRVLRIRQLTELGFSLSQIAGLPERGPDARTELTRLHRELDDTIERLERTRSAVATLLAEPEARIDTEHHLADLTGGALTPADRAFLTVVARVVSPEVLEAWHAMIRETRGEPVLEELDDLTCEAPEPARAALTRRLESHLRRVHAGYPLLVDPALGSPNGASLATDVLRRASIALYNDAQVDVVRRAGGIA